MMQASLCVGNYAKIPYRMDGIDVSVFSAEELCRCMKDNAFLLDASLMNDALLEWLERECGLGELTKELHPLVHKKGSLSAFVTMIMEYVSFYPAGVIQELERILKQGAGLGKIEKRKNQIDYLAERKRYTSALKGYEELLSRWEQGPDRESGALPAAEVKASILYNKGVVYTRLFLYGQAGDAFYEAYKLDERQEYLEAWMAAKRLELPEEEYVALISETPKNHAASLELERKLEALEGDWMGSAEYQRMQMRARWHGEETESSEEDENGLLLESLLQQYRDSTED